MTALKFLGAGIAGVVVGLLLAAASQGNGLGGVYSQVEKTFAQGIEVGKTGQFAVDEDGDLLTSGSLRSDKTGFCFDFYATSTATRVKMTASSTATIEGTDGVMVTSYGSCS